MGGCLKGCVGRALALAVLAVGGVLAWQYAPPEWRGRLDGVRDRVAEWTGGEGSQAPASDADPELAEATLDRVERFRSGTGAGDQLSLSQEEVSSVVRYALPGILPAGVTDPAIEMSGGRIILSAEVAVENFPVLTSLDRVAAFLPDTVPIHMSGVLAQRDDASLTLHVDGVRAGGLSLPKHLIPEILRALGRQETEGLSPHAMIVPLPQGLRAAYVRRDSLVLVADR